MALNLKKKRQPPVKLSLTMEHPAYETFASFLLFLQEREENPEITANEVINEIIREYLSGTAADVRGWREQQALDAAAKLPKQSTSAAAKQNNLTVAKLPEGVVVTQRAAEPAVATSPAAPSSALPQVTSKEVEAQAMRQEEPASPRLDISPEKQRQLIDEEKKRRGLLQDPSKTT